MIYEVRLYTIVAGRLNVALERFERGLPPIFARHGIRNVGRWVATAGVGGPMFVYMMAYRDLAERESQWAGFYADEDWFNLRARTQGDEEATERFDILFLRQHSGWTPPSPVPSRVLGGVHELIFGEVGVGKSAAADSYLFDHYLPAAESAGAHVMLVADVISGPSLPRIAMLLAWPDAASHHAGHTKLDGDRGLQSAIALQRRELGRPAIGRIDTILLNPTPRLLPDATLGRDTLEGDRR